MKKLGKWIDKYSKSGQWLLYQDQNGNFYSRVYHEDTEWKVYERTKKGTQLTCIDTTEKYRPTKHSVPVQTHTSTGGKIHKELGAELKINEELPEGPVESFEQLVADQPS